MGLYLGLDVGTTTLSGLALDSVNGDVIAQISLRNDAARSYRDQDGLLCAELDPQRLYDRLMSLLTEIADVLPSGPTIEAIGVTGQQHGMALLTAQCEPVGPAITWQDQRVQAQRDDGESYLQAFVRQAGGPEAFHPMGCIPSAGFMGPTLYWLADRTDLLDRAAHVCFIPDLAVTLLTGRAPVSDPTNAGSSGLFDLTKADWAWQIIERLRLPRHLFPPIKAAGVPRGLLKEQIANATGLPPIPVCVAAGDNQASFVGSVRVPEDSVLVNVGTGGQISATVERFVRLANVETRAFFGGDYLLVGAGLYGGRAYAYLQEFFRAIGAALWQTDSDAELYDRMNALAREVPPGAEGLRFEPLFTGTRADPSLRATLSGIGPTSFRPGHVTRALLEGIAEGFYTLYQEMAPYLGERHTLVGAGNGLTRNPVLAEIVARRFGLPLCLASDIEAAARGAALLAASGADDTSLTEAMSRLAYDSVVRC